MKSPQLHEHKGGFSDCRIWPIYIAYSLTGLLLISAFGSVGAFIMAVVTYGSIFPILNWQAKRAEKPAKVRIKRSYTLPSFSFSLVRKQLHKKAA